MDDLFVHPTQRDKIRQLFESRPNQWVPLPEVMRYSAQYNARVYELRREGLNIVNKTKEVDGTKHSWFMLVKCS